MSVWWNLGSRSNSQHLRLDTMARRRHARAAIAGANDMAGLMEGKVAVVTGAGGGVGREIAIMMAKAGARVIIADIGASLSGEGGSASPAEQTKALINQQGGLAEICAESVAAWGSARKIIQAAMDHYGRIDAVVNNAGILRDGIFHRMSEDDWLSVISVHLNGSFFVSRAAAEHYRAQQSGSFVHITSTSGLVGNIGQANYSAAKLGITALSKSIALDMARYNVRSNCLSPWAWSRMTSSIPVNTHAGTGGGGGETGSKMTPDKNAPLAVFLSSAKAEGISGQVFGTRLNEIYLFSLPRPVRIIHNAEGWTPESIAAIAAPALGSRIHAAGYIGDVVQLGSDLKAGWSDPTDGSRRCSCLWRNPGVAETVEEFVQCGLIDFDMFDDQRPDRWLPSVWRAPSSTSISMPSTSILIRSRRGKFSESTETAGRLIILSGS